MKLCYEQIFHRRGKKKKVRKKSFDVNGNERAFFIRYGISINRG